MNIAIIGAGFTGLSAAREFQKNNHNVTVFEKESIPGGLAIGFKADHWEWSLEKHYHHIFQSDKDIQELAKDVGVQFDFPYPSTSWLIDNDIYRLDSPLRLLTFPKLSLIDRLRMGIILGFFKIIPYSSWLEKYAADEWLPQLMGKKGYEMLWKPLFVSKFGSFANQISLAWFWARIKARTPKLGYPEGGFQQLAEAVSQKIISEKGTIFYNTTVEKIESQGEKVSISYNGKTELFDKVLVTLPNFFFSQLAPSLPTDYKENLLSFKGIGAVNLVLELKEKFFKNDVYWLSICQKEYPFLAVVEHTNFIDAKHYGGNHLVYIGNYLSTDHRYFNLSKEELLQEYDAYLQKLCPGYEKSLLNTYLFKAPFAQPIVTTNFSKKILPFKTPFANVYLANIQQVYPWDRGTNYAVEMGKRVVKEMI